MKNNEFFAASNTGRGFVSGFGVVFDPKKYDAVYIIKGGPGTGKSTFMKKIGERAEELGYTVFYYRCSSDVRSYDGVAIEELKVCVLDGTAPHVTEAKFPGACEIIVDFYDAFDVTGLRKMRGRIEELSEACSERYGRAYKLLSVARDLFFERCRVCRTAYRADKAAAYALRLVSGMPKGFVAEDFIGTVCAEGYVRLPSFAFAADRVAAAVEYYGAEYLIITDVVRAAVKTGAAARASRFPVCDDFFDSVLFSGGLCVCTVGDDCPDGAKKLNTPRFTDNSKLLVERGYLRMVKKMYDSALDGAASEMKKALDLHGELEKIYTECTDFSVIDEILAETSERIF